MHMPTIEYLSGTIGIEQSNGFLISINWRKNIVNRQTDREEEFNLSSYGLIMWTTYLCNMCAIIYFRLW